MTPEERAHMSKLWKELARSYRLSFHNEREMSREFRRQRDEAQPRYVHLATTTGGAIVSKSDAEKLFEERIAELEAQLAEMQSTLQDQVEMQVAEFADRYCQLQAERNNLRAQLAQRWIPVEEQAVPANRECLMLGEYNNITVGCCDSDGKAFIYEWGGMERVTHWQPLPPLPTE